MPRAPHLHDWITLFALAGLWGSAFMFNELALQSFTPPVIVAGRLVIAAIMLLILLMMSGVSVFKGRHSWLSIFIIALLGTILPFHLTAWAQQHIDSAVTGILMAVMPLFVLSSSHFLLPGERLTTYRIVGLLCGFIGVFFVIGPDSFQFANSNMELWGMLAVLGAALSYSVSSVYTRRMGSGNPTALATGVIFVGSLVALPLAASDLATPSLPPTGVAVAAILALGLLCTGFASILYFRVVQGPGPTFLSLVNYLIPIWAMLIGALVLGESINALAYVGLVLILTGIAISEFGQRLRRKILRDRERHSVPQTLSVAEEDT